MIYTIDKDGCIICGACIVACRAKAIIRKEGKAFIQPDKCTGCGRCVCKCYTRAIHEAK